MGMPLFLAAPQGITTHCLAGVRLGRTCCKLPTDWAEVLVMPLHSVCS